MLSSIVKSQTTGGAPMSKIIDPDFLADFEKEADWAAGHGISQRTASRYRALPNGLPFLFFGGYVWIPKREGREWIASRVKRHNLRRQRHQAITAEIGAA
jgi:hypothetical protein